MANLSNINNKFLVTDGGDVGIGVTSPGSKLQIGAGTSNADRSLIASLGGSANGILSALSLVSSTGNNAVGYGVGIDFHLASTYSPTGRIATIAEDTSVKAGLAFYTYESGYIQERMRITSSDECHVELSGTAPTIKATAGNGVSGLRINIAGQTSSQIFRIQEDGATKFQIDHDGDVAIGTTSISAGAKLDVNGSLAIANTGQINLTRTLNTNNLWYGMRYDNNEVQIYTYYPSDRSITFNTVSGGTGITTQLMKIETGGNVGIGTPSPNTDLHVNSENAEGSLTLSRGGNNMVSGQGVGSIVFAADYNGTPANYGKIVTYANALSALRGSIDFKVKSTSGSLLTGLTVYGTSSGPNVGIGTTLPATKLHVENTNAAIVYVKSTVNNQNASIFFNSNSGGTQADRWEIGTNISAGSDLEFFDRLNSVSRMVIQNDGNVGIGTISPSEKLSVNGNIFLEGNNSYIAFNTSASSGHPKISMGSDADFSFLNTAGSNLLHIENGGNIGIGNTSPSYKLQVEGDTYINGRDIGKAVNYASSQGWTPMTSLNSVQGYFGGDFTRNGATNENKIEWDYNYAGQRALIWRTQNNDSGSNDDGGWNKMMKVASNNMGYMSIVYVKRNTSSSNGSFYHGCWGGNTLYLNGVGATNPYFHNFSVGNLPQDVWCISIGFIQANNDSNTVQNPAAGVYRLDTGAKVYNSSSTFKMGTNTSVQQQHRVYLYYSTVTTQNLSFSNPGFYALDGSQPSINNLLQG